MRGIAKTETGGRNVPGYAISAFYTAASTIYECGIHRASNRHGRQTRRQVSGNRSILILGLTIIRPDIEAKFRTDER